MWWNGCGLRVGQLWVRVDIEEGEIHIRIQRPTKQNNSDGGVGRFIQVLHDILSGIDGALEGMNICDSLITVDCIRCKSDSIMCVDLGRKLSECKSFLCVYHQGTTGARSLSHNNQT